MQHELERLKRENAKLSTENEILKATSGSVGKNSPNPFDTPANSLEEPTHTGPLGYSPSDFYAGLDIQKNGSVSPRRSNSPTHSRPNGAKRRKYSVSHKVHVSPDTGERLLAAGATWDYIQAHDLFQKGLVDVGDVCERLKKVARCDGQGPVFEESDIRKAIEESAVAGGRDELI